jgi:hypothetical protein
LRKFRTELSQKQNEIRERESNITELKTRKLYFEDEIKNLQAEYNRKKKLLEVELEKQYLSESDLTRKIREKDQNISTLKKEIEILSYQIKIVDDNPHVPQAKRYQFNIWNSQETLKYLKKDQENNLESIKRFNEKMKKSERAMDSLNAKSKVKTIHR